MFLQKDRGCPHRIRYPYHSEERFVWFRNTLKNYLPQQGLLIVHLKAQSSSLDKSMLVYLSHRQRNYQTILSDCLIHQKWITFDLFGTSPGWTEALHTEFQIIKVSISMWINQRLGDRSKNLFFNRTCPLPQRLWFNSGKKWYRGYIE